jgi:hypothetical protein
LSAQLCAEDPAAWGDRAAGLPVRSSVHPPPSSAHGHLCSQAGKVPEPPGSSGQQPSITRGCVPVVGRSPRVPSLSVGQEFPWKTKILSHPGGC